MRSRPPGHRACQPRLNHAEHRQPGVSAVDAVPTPLPGATAATGCRDPRDWLHAASLSVADRDRNAGHPSSPSSLPTRSDRLLGPTLAMSVHISSVCARGYTTPSLGRLAVWRHRRRDGQARCRGGHGRAAGHCRRAARECTAVSSRHRHSGTSCTAAGASSGHVRCWRCIRAGRTGTRRAPAARSPVPGARRGRRGSQRSARCRGRTGTTRCPG
jgi:hypothetical protein